MTIYLQRRGNYIYRIGKGTTTNRGYQCHWGVWGRSKIELPIHPPPAQYSITGIILQGQLLFCEMPNLRRAGNCTHTVTGAILLFGVVVGTGTYDRCEYKLGFSSRHDNTQTAEAFDHVVQGRGIIQGGRRGHELRNTSF